MRTQHLFLFRHGDDTPPAGNLGINPRGVSQIESAARAFERIILPTKVQTMSVLTSRINPAVASRNIFLDELAHSNLGLTIETRFLESLADSNYAAWYSAISSASEDAVVVIGHSNINEFPEYLRSEGYVVNWQCRYNSTPHGKGFYFDLVRKAWSPFPQFWR
jgi:hypothetical protein